MFQPCNCRKLSRFFFDEFLDEAGWNAEVKHDLAETSSINLFRMRF
jgi:hypothetical protein